MAQSKEMSPHSRPNRAKGLKFLIQVFHCCLYLDWGYVVIFPTLFIGWLSTAYSCQQLDDRICWFLREFSGTFLFKWAQYFQLCSGNSVSLLSEQGFTNASLILIYNHSLFFSTCKHWCLFCLKVLYLNQCNFSSVLSECIQATI